MKESNRLPKSAMALYIKLYCKKNGRKKNRKFNLVEASKSWVSLSKTDKQVFLNAFKDYEAKIKRCFASNLQRAQLYMKKKHDNPKRSCENLPKQATVVYNNLDEDQDEDEDQDIHKTNSFSKNENNELAVHNVELNGSSTNIAAEIVPDDVGSKENCEEPHLVKNISEPTPPVKTSMELFEIIKNKEDSAQNVNWSDLSKLQKNRYQRAVLNIKKNYLKQYTAYLQLLPQEKLFQHYKSKF